MSDDFDPGDVHSHGEQPKRGEWTAKLLQEVMRSFYQDYEAILFNQEARANHNTVITVIESRRWSVRQVLLDDLGDRLWYINGEIDLTDQETPEGALITLLEINSHGIS